MLGLTWPYRKVYTLDEVARMRCRFTRPLRDEDEPYGFASRKRCEKGARHWLGWKLVNKFGDHDQWVRRKVPLRLVEPGDPGGFLPCMSRELARYTFRRREGGRFPPILLTRPLPDEHYFSKPWIARDGAHRLSAARCVGDKYIDAFVPIRKPPRKR